jgi:hypothetical protein
MITSTHNAPTGKRQLLLERVPAGRFHFMKDKLFEMLGGMTSVSIKPGEVWYDYLHQMVLRHPDAADKIGAGVAAFIVRRKTRMGNTYPELFVERIDGTTIDVSWRKCEKGMDYGNAPSHRAPDSLLPQHGQGERPLWLLWRSRWRHDAH